MSEKRMVGRNVAIVLAIICIILVAGIGTIWVYYLVQDINKNQTITSLNTQVFNDNSEIENLQNQLNNFTDIVNLVKSTAWVNNKYENLWDGNPIYNTPLYEGNATYAGYIIAQVSTQWPNNTAEVTYSFQGLTFDDKTNFNGNTTATFRIMPSSDIKVYIFTEGYGILTGPLDSYTTITYYY